MRVKISRDGWHWVIGGLWFVGFSVIYPWYIVNPGYYYSDRFLWNIQISGDYFLRLALVILATTVVVAGLVIATAHMDEGAQKRPESTEDKT